MTRTYANNFKTTLNGTITNSQTTMIVTSVSGAPTVGGGSTTNFTITDGTNYEIVQATALSTNTYTIVRAQESTTARAWSSGAIVSCNVTAASFNVTTSPTASTYAGWDTNSNLSANNFLASYTTTSTAAGTTTLTVASTELQYFTGTTTQTVVLPVTSTLVLGFPFRIFNNSTGVVTVQSSGSNTILNLAANTSALFICILTTGTTAASWGYTYYPLANSSNILPAANIEIDSTPTPVLNFGGTTTGITYSTQICKKSIVGNLCTLNIQINLSSKGTATGSATITGVATAPRGGTLISVACMLENTTLANLPTAWFTSTTINLATVASGGFFTSLTDTSFTNSSNVYVNVTYAI